MTTPTTVRLRIPKIALLYLGLFALVALFWPFAVAARLAKTGSTSLTIWPAALATTLLWTLFLLHVAKRCSGPSLSFWRGLLVVAGSMTTGSHYLSLLIVIPALTIVLLLSISFALLSDFGTEPDRAAARFRNLVARSYRWRMRQ